MYGFFCDCLSYVQKGGELPSNIGYNNRERNTEKQQSLIQSDYYCDNENNIKNLQLINNTKIKVEALIKSQENLGESSRKNDANSSMAELK